MNFKDFVNFLYWVEEKLEVFSGIEQNYSLYDTVTTEENAFPAPKLNENPKQTMSDLLTTLKQKAQPWKREIGLFFRKAVSLMKQ